MKLKYYNEQKDKRGVSVKKIAVLHAQIAFSSGGAELMVKSLTKELKKRGFEAELISIPFRWYPEYGLYDNMLMWEMLDLTEVNGKKIDLVIPTKFPTYGVKHPNKVLWLMHQHRAAYDLYDNKEHYGFGTIEHGDKMRNAVRNFDNNSLKESKRIYTISKNVGKRLENNNGLESDVLYHPPSQYGNYYCEEYGDYILSVGRLDPLKRNDLLIKGLQYCDKKVKLLVVGKGPEAEGLKKLVSALNLESRVRFLGFVDDVKLLKLYAESLGVFFAPVDEDYGYVTLEAFLSKKPVITCYDSGGVLEFVQADKSGFVCDTVPEEIGRAIDTLYYNKRSAIEMGNCGFDAVKNISWDNVINKLTANI